MRRLPFIIALSGVLLFLGGAGMRGYAQALMAQTERRLLAARPAAPGTLTRAATPSLSSREGAGGEVDPPTLLRLPRLELWNTLEAVHNEDGIWETSDAGWHDTSSLPGQGGNIVIAGHSPSGRPDVWARSVFRQLAYLTPGEWIELTAGGRVYSYRVEAVFAIPASEAAAPEATIWLERGNHERLTLITCWPPHTAAYRVIVIAHPEMEN